MIHNIENAKIAIVGGGRFCEKLLRHLFGHHFEGRHPEVLGVADINPEAVGLAYAVPGEFTPAATIVTSAVWKGWKPSSR